MLAHMLQGCGFTVGLFTSPHLLDIRERIQINQEMISETNMMRMLSRIAPIAKKSSARNAPTFFEIVTAASFLYFAEKNVDIAVVETGLGGRLDSTNVLKPEVCGITSISLDHQAQLGATLDKIAEEKAGIFKPGVPVVSAPQAGEVKDTLRRVALKSGSSLRFTGEDIHFSVRFESSAAVGPHTRVCVTTESSRFEHLHVPLLGEHQAINCGVALGMMDALKERGFEIDDDKAIEGLERVSLAGRMEMIYSEPRVLVDGAHNAASIEALMRAIGQNIPYDSMVVVFACQSDKDVDGMLQHIRLGADKVIFTTAGAPRSCDPQELATRFVETTGKMAQVVPNLDGAIRMACAAVTREDLICVTGSFYLVGAVKQLPRFQNK